jgi:hypothetical protein
MKKPPAILSLSLLAASLLIAGCRSVEEGPTAPPNPNAQREVYGVVPKPAPIPQKNIPEGESSLRHDKPNG